MKGQPIMLICRQEPQSMPQLAELSLTPVPFIVGAARSGTTLLRLMLDSHPELAIPAEARFIHLIRDGRDVALSVRSVPFGPNSIREAAEWWASSIRSAREQANELRFYREVRYEDLVLDTEGALREICRFIDLDWHPGL